MRVSKLVFLLLFAVPASFAETWSLPFFTSDPRSVLAAAARYSVHEDVPALILDCSISAHIDDAGLLHKTTRIVSKVVRVQGIETVQTMQIPWSVARQIHPTVKARVITGDGQAHVLDDTGIAEKEAPNPDYVGAVNVLAVSLPDVNVDSVIELEIQEGDREPALPGARFAQIEVPPGYPIAHFKATITSAGAADLQLEARSFPQAKVATDSASKGHAYSVEAFNFQPVSLGANLPPDVAPFPTIAFTNVPSWQSVAQWYAGVLAKALPAPAVAAPAPSPGDQIKTIEKIYEDLRKNIHDNNRDLASGPLAPHTPAETLKSGSGDSKDQATLLISKLAVAGIPAKLAFINTDPHPDVVPSLPGFEAFDHALVYVPGPTPLWIDPAAEYTSVARLPFRDQDRSALIIDPATTQLVRTPGSMEKDNRDNADVEIRLGDGKPTAVSETIEGYGTFEDALRPLISQVSGDNEQEKQTLALQLLRGVGGQQLDSTKSSNPHQLLEKPWLTITGEGFPTSSIADDGGYVDLPGIARLNMQQLGPLLRVTADTAGQPFAPGRTVDFYIAPPFTIEHRYHVVPPFGYRIKDAPPSGVVNIGPLSITINSKLDNDGSLRCSYILLQPKTRISPQELQNMRSAVAKIANQTSIRVQLENIAAAKLKSGDFIEGLKLLRQDADAAKEKDTITPSLRLASGYVLIGARSAALKLCDDLLKPRAGHTPADADLASIHARLGWIYQHDEFGRPLSPGMNVAEAEKHLKQATDLVSNDPAFWFELADLYTYNAAGVHYGRSARVNDAAEIFSKLDLNAVARAGKMNDYALALLHARKFGELHEFFLYPQSDSLDQGVKWAGIAASSSESDFKEELDFRFPSGPMRQAVLVQAGRQLVEDRDYQTAARLFRLAGKDSPVSQAEIDRVDRIHNFDESTVSKQPALAVFQRYVQAVLDPETGDDWKKFVVADLQTSTLQEQRTALLEIFSRMIAINPSPDVLPYLSNLIDTTLTFTPDGSDAIGFLIKTGTTPVAYVVKQGSGYLVAGLQNSQAPLTQAVAFARSGNLAAARQWVDWQRESAGVPKLADADVQPMLDTLSAELLLSQGKSADAVAILQRLHNQKPSDRRITFLLADSLIQNNRFSDAQPYIDSLQTLDPVSALRLREHLTAQQGNYTESASIAKQICARPDATAADWNDLAWTTLFTQQNAPDAKAAAEKAAQLTNFNSAPILHTLALAQAAAADLKGAIATAQKFDSISGNSNEMYTISARIAEQCGLTNIASEYYSHVPEEPGPRLSNYAFARLRLAALPAPVVTPTPTSSAEKRYANL